MPVPFEQTPTGTILVREPEATTHTVALYAGVPMHATSVGMRRVVLNPPVCNGMLVPWQEASHPIVNG